MKKINLLKVLFISIIVIALFVTTAFAAAQNINIPLFEKANMESTDMQNANKEQETEKSTEEVNSEKESNIQSNNNKKTMIINGKSEDFSFVETKKAEGNWKHDRKIYASDDGSKIIIDAASGVLLSYEKAYEKRELSQKITESNAKKIAETFIKPICDISSYLFDISYNDSVGYVLEYKRLINGYETKEKISVIMESDGTIKLFSHNPYVFENIDTDAISINEETLKAKLHNKLTDAYGADVAYQLNGMTLSTNDDGELVMEMAVLVNTTTDSIKKTHGVVFTIEV